MKTRLKIMIERRGYGYLTAFAGTAAITALLAPFSARLSSTTVALALLLLILFIATVWGSKPALLGSALAGFCFNFFFLPPVGTLTIADLQNWVALAAFLVTAVTAGELSARVKRRAEEAEAGRREIERLYVELRDAFERASQAESLRRSEQLKTALLDAVTHDLRTPLTSIKASVTTLLDEASSARGDLDAAGRTELLQVIDEESDRLNRFVEGLVELARIEAGNLQLRRRWGAVDEIISIALSRAERLTRHHAVQTDLGGELPLIKVDARAVAEVVYCLIENAAKYSPRGSRILIAARIDPPEMVSISIQDEGSGILREHREKVFEKFYRVIQRESPGQRGRPHGMGMGLAIARGIVEAHGGAIRIEDGDGGRGTRVVFTVPIGDEENADENFANGARERAAVN